MKPAMIELANVIDNTKFDLPICPVFQNVVADPVTDPLEIKKPSRSSYLTCEMDSKCKKMIEYGITEFIDVGPEKYYRVSKENFSDVKVSGFEK